MDKIKSAGAYQQHGQSIATIDKDETDSPCFHKKPTLELNHEGASNANSNAIFSPLRGPAAVVHHHKRSANLNAATQYTNEHRNHH